jgi:hypothetical protein
MPDGPDLAAGLERGNTVGAGELAGMDLAALASSEVPAAALADLSGAEATPQPSTRLEGASSSL